MNNRIQTKIEQFNKLTDCKKTLIDIVYSNGRYCWKVKCPDCGNVKVARSLKDVNTCSRGTSCYSKAMSKSVASSPKYLKTRKVLKESWTDERKEKHSKLLKATWTDDMRKQQSEKIKQYYNNWSDEDRLLHIQRTQAGMPKMNSIDYMIMQEKKSKTLREERIKEHPNLRILYDKDLTIQYLDSLTEKPSIYELVDFFGISYQYIVMYLREYDLLDKINYTESPISVFQKDVEAFITSLGVNYESSVHGILSNKKLELDIYIPEHNIAIECNGLYYHYYPVKSKDYHLNKSRLCEEKGIRLIHIWEHEWEDEHKRTILKSIIKSALGLVNHKVYARDTYCSVEESKTLKDFANENHIAGFRGGKFALTLRDKKTDELYMAFIIGNSYFGKGKYQYEVIRGITKLNTLVVGGVSKLWKYFIKNYNPESCVYYVDYNYFNGNSVEKLGLTYVTSKHGVWDWWGDTREVTNRDPRHHKEIMKLVDEGKVFKIYNAGTKVYV